MIERYTLPEMGQIWTESSKFQSWLKVEIAACEANCSLGNIPKEDFQEIFLKAKFEESRIKEIEREVKERHTLAFDTNLNFSNELDVGGDLAFRVNGEEHVWKPETITLLQHSVRSENYNQFKKYTSSVDDQTKKLKNLRGLLNFKKINKPISIEQV